MTGLEKNLNIVVKTTRRSPLRFNPRHEHWGLVPEQGVRARRHRRADNTATTVIRAHDEQFSTAPRELSTGRK